MSLASHLQVFAFANPSDWKALFPIIPTSKNPIHTFKD